MKRVYLTFTIIITFYCSFAQSIFPTDGSNVGIGTTNPSSALDVAGLIQISGINASSPPAGLSYGLFGYGGVGLGIFSGATNSTQGIGFWTNPNGTKKEVMRILSGGNIGIGTTNPIALLHIAGNGASVDGGDAYPINGNDLAIQANTGSRSTAIGAQLEFVIPANMDGGNLWGQARIITVAGNTSNGNATGEMILGTRRYFNKLGSGTQWYYGNDLTIDGSGNIGINTINTYGYKLAVNGSAIATSMTVKAYANWPDYVFKPAYHLSTLQEVKTYIDKNHHLPEIPSEQEIERSGLNLGEMNKLLVKKVEELTLYLLENNEKNIEEESELNKQQQKILGQEKHIKILESKLDLLLNNTN